MKLEYQKLFYNNKIILNGILMKGKPYYCYYRLIIGFEHLVYDISYVWQRGQRRPHLEKMGAYEGKTNLI